MEEGSDLGPSLQVVFFLLNEFSEGRFLCLQHVLKNLAFVRVGFLRKPPLEVLDVRLGDKPVQNRTYPVTPVLNTPWMASKHKASSERLAYVIGAPCTAAATCGRGHPEQLPG